MRTRRQARDKQKLPLRRETVRKLAAGELSMVVGGDFLPEARPTCPNESCIVSCPNNTGHCVYDL